ncbi:response regulator [Reichenbachiella sp.]|uniref:response regulator n=1 Tax=Reichenbachiella sp. TaxID=2184521 RepID=UPI003296D31B
MERLYIVCVEDQKEVLNTIAQQLSYFEDFLSVEECETADEAFGLLEQIERKGDQTAVVVSDHVMPGMTGVEFFAKLKEDARFSAVRKILLTGQATHTDTIDAINRAGIDNYIEKPWKAEVLLDKVAVLLTKYIIHAGLDYQPYVKVLDKQTLFDLLKTG